MGKSVSGFEKALADHLPLKKKTEICRSIESKPMHTYVIAFNPGIADIVEKEVRQINPVALISDFYEMQGWLKVSKVALEELFHVQSIEKIIELKAAFKFDKTLDDLEARAARTEIPELTNAKSFRVSTRRYGNHDFGSNEVQVVAGNAFQQNYGTAVSLKDYEVHLRVDIMGKFAFIGIQYTSEKYWKRFNFEQYHRAGIKPAMAYALLTLADVQPGETILDPFTGSGTIPIQAASMYKSSVTIMGGDLYDDVIASADANAELNNLGPYIESRQMNVFELDSYVTGPIDKIVTNPPYGVKSATKSNMRKLYRAFIVKAAMLLREEGKMVVMLQRSDMFRQIVSRTKLFKIIEERVVESGSLHPHIFVLGKIDEPE